MASNRLITLTTDFGEGSPYVAQMKAAILTVRAEATIVDVTHSIRPHDVRHGALVIDEVALRFPAETVHVCVVDPGVGTARKIICARIDRHTFVAPDNGLLSLLAGRMSCTKIVAVRAPEYWNPSVSPTFHGRDIMAPVAAHVSLGVALEKLGASHETLVQIPWPDVESAPQALRGAVLAIDRFGNLITNIDRSMLPAPDLRHQLRIVCRHRKCGAWVDAYGERPAGSLVALIGSNNRLEIAVTEGHAASLLGATVGDAVHVTWD